MSQTNVKCFNSKSAKLSLQPKNFKSKKRQKGRKLIHFNSNYKLRYGDAGLITLRPLIFTTIHLFRLKLLLKRASRKGDKTRRKLWFSMFPQLPLSKKPANVRMGKGKGKLKTWFLNVRGGAVLAEYKNVRYGRSLYFFKQATFKLGVVTKSLFSQNFLFDFPLRPDKKVFFRSFWN